MNIFQKFFQLSKQKGHGYHINYMKNNSVNFDFAALFAWRITILHSLEVVNHVSETQLQVNENSFK